MLTAVIPAAHSYTQSEAIRMTNSDFESRVTDGYAGSNGVKIHYTSFGSGPLMVMVPGFPDFWYTSRPQMEGLADQYQCVAIDQPGYNQSGQPPGLEHHDIHLAS